jgi:hypothetical protein
MSYIRYDSALLCPLRCVRGNLYLNLLYGNAHTFIDRLVPDAR